MVVISMPIACFPAAWLGMAPDDSAGSQRRLVTYGFPSQATSAVEILLVASTVPASATRPARGTAEAVSIMKMKGDMTAVRVSDPSEKIFNRLNVCVSGPWYSSSCGEAAAFSNTAWAVFLSGGTSSRLATEVCRLRVNANAEFWKRRAETYALCLEHACRPMRCGGRRRKRETLLAIAMYNLNLNERALLRAYSRLSSSAEDDTPLLTLLSHPTKSCRE